MHKLIMIASIAVLASLGWFSHTPHQAFAQPAAWCEYNATGDGVTSGCTCPAMWDAPYFDEYASEWTQADECFDFGSAIYGLWVYDGPGEIDSVGGQNGGSPCSPSVSYFSARAKLFPGGDYVVWGVGVID